MSARDEILSRVRDAVADVTTPPRAGTVVSSSAGAAGSGDRAEGPARDETLALFAENVADYRATVLRTTGEKVPGVLADVLVGLGCRSVVVPTGLDPAWVSRLPDTVSHACRVRGHEPPPARRRRRRRHRLERRDSRDGDHRAGPRHRPGPA